MGKLRKKGLIYKIFLWLILIIIDLGNIVRKIIGYLISPFVTIFKFFYRLFAYLKTNKHSIYKSSIYKWRVKENSLSLFNIFFQFIKYLFKVLLTFVFKIFFIITWCLKLFFIRIPRSIVHHVSLKIRYFIFGFFVCLAVLIINQAYSFIKELPSPREIGKSNYSLSTHLLDYKGRLLYEIYREQNRTPVKLDQLPIFVTQATIAIEDKDFYRHKGVAVAGGILRAAKEIVLNNSLQGGSTITQQLVKTALLSPERTIKRKIKEIILALWAEKIYSKNQILEMYLNQVPYGGAAHGIEEAAKVYFGVHAYDLSLEQAAFLAGLPQAPSLYSPYVNPVLAQKRRNDVLRRMEMQDFISPEVSIKLQNTKLEVISPRTNIKAPHFVFYVKSQLEEKYGIRQIEEGGLKVTTTLDLDIQEQAEKILKEELEKVKDLNVSNGAILVTRPSTGEILAMVGSVDYFASPSGAFNVTTGLRQPGSSIKPIMYSLALEKDYTAASIISDTPVVFNVPGSIPYRPVNYDGKTHGNVPLRYALANSFNIPAVRVLNTLGVINFIDYAKKMGISTWTDPNRFGLSLTLGGGEVTMIDMARAFGVFANEGYRVNLTSFNQIVTSANNLFYQYDPMSVRVIDEGNAFIINDILSDNFARRWAFGSNSALEINGFKVAVKTGTTDEKKDNWTIGYTPDYMVVVWVGNNNNQPMNPYLASGITGAAPIWNRVMSYLLKTYGAKNQFTKPENIVEKLCYFGKVEYFVKGTENKASCRDNLFGVSPSPTP